MTMPALVPFGWSSPLLPGRPANDDPFVRLWNEVDRLFGQVFRATDLGGWPQGQGYAFGPPVEVAETPEAWKLVAELPGVAPEDVTIELQGDVLTIKGEKKAEREEGEATWTVRERRYGSFLRSLRLPFPVEAETIEAAYRNGVLTVTVPKPAALRRQVKRIEVKAAA